MPRDFNMGYENEEMLGNEHREIQEDEEVVNPEDDDSEADYYDTMRDDSGCELWTDLGKLKKFYVDAPTGHLIYFKDNPKKFWECVISNAECELKTLAKQVIK